MECPGCINGWPRVTSVLHSKPMPWLDAWKAKWGVLAERKTAAANAIGTAFHKAVEERQGPVTNRVKNMYATWLLWACGQRFVSLSEEVHVYSVTHKYHGTLDAIGTLGGKKELILMDWKTSSGIRPDMALQLSAYAEAYKEMTGVVLKRGIIVLVSKDKPEHKLTVKEFKLNKRLFNKFLKRKKEMEANSEWK